MGGTEMDGQKPEVEALRELTRVVDQSRTNAIRDLQTAIDASKELLKRVAEKPKAP